MGVLVELPNHLCHPDLIKPAWRTLEFQKPAQHNSENSDENNGLFDRGDTDVFC